jgi:predicted peroxiredoxin
VRRRCYRPLGYGHDLNRRDVATIRSITASVGIFSLAVAGKGVLDIADKRRSRTALSAIVINRTPEEAMLMRKMFAALVLLGCLATMPAAADTRSLFVNMTSEDAHRADMAMVFSKAMLERGHPVTLWLNDKAVLLASRQQTEKAPQQKMLSELMGKGVKVIACPMCMKHFGVVEGDLIDGVVIGNPDLTSSLLFKENTQTLTW